MSDQTRIPAVTAVALVLIVASFVPNATPLLSFTQAPPPASPSPGPSAPATRALRDTHERLNGVLWMQTAAEYRVACETVFGSAALALDVALRDPTWTAALEQSGTFRTLPPAIVVDLDETVLDNSPFWGRLVAERTGYDNELWAEWVARANATAVPGAIDFLRLAERKGVAVFYITNRNANMEAATRTNLTRLGLDLPTSIDTVLMNGERPDWSSDKASRRSFVATAHRVLLLVGDDLGDFLSSANNTPEERIALAGKFPSFWGSRWFLLPNPVAGSWESALYGNMSNVPDQVALGKKLEALNFFGKPARPTAAPAVAAASVTVTYADDKCTLTGPQKVAAGKLDVDWIIVDKDHDLLGLCAVTLDAGETIDDLRAWGSAEQPPWVQLIGCWNGAPDSRKTVIFELKRGLNYLVCFTSPTTYIGPLGPIDVE